MAKTTAPSNKEDLVERWHEQIFDAVSTLFSEKGYQATSMRDISHASGINLSYLYKYVSSKNEILYIFYDRTSRLFYGIYEDLASDTETDPAQKLKQFFSDILTVIHENKYPLRTMWTESRHLESQWLRLVLEREYSCVKAVESVIIRGVDKGCFKVNDSLMAANSIQYLMFIEPMRGWVLRERYSLEDLIESITDLAMRYLGVTDS
ncbi:MAG: TetR/AcrR family transcriptional regulator [Proteobacteria bacterium]|nr:TetR/AcrR family transcriptional regulator [Pseudomonadota bacterium]